MGLGLRTRQTITSLAKVVKTLIVVIGNLWRSTECFKVSTRCYIDSHVHIWSYGVLGLRVWSRGGQCVFWEASRAEIEIISGGSALCEWNREKGGGEDPGKRYIGERGRGVREEFHVCGVWYFMHRVQSLTLCTMVIRPFPFVWTWKLCVDVANIGSENLHCTVWEKKYAQSQIFTQKSSTAGSVGCHYQVWDYLPLGAHWASDGLLLPLCQSFSGALTLKCTSQPRKFLSTSHICGGLLFIHVPWSRCPGWHVCQGQADQKWPSSYGFQCPPPLSSQWRTLAPVLCVGGLWRRDKETERMEIITS